MLCVHSIKKIVFYVVGIRGTYQGLTATVLKQGSNQAIRFYVMTALRNWYKGAVDIVSVILFVNKL